MPSRVQNRLIAVAFTLLTVATIAALLVVNRAPEPHDWPAHGGDSGHRQYSTLDQIDRGNVGSLRVAWTYYTADKRADNRSPTSLTSLKTGR